LLGGPVAPKAPSGRDPTEAVVRARRGRAAVRPRDRARDGGQDAAPVEPVETAAADAPTPPTPDLGSGGSLFDIQTDEQPAGASTTDAAPVEPVETTAAQAPAAPATADLASGGSLFDIAAPYVVSAEPMKKAEPEPAPEPEPDVETERQLKPATSGEAHTPKTDVDINESGSLRTSDWGRSLQTVARQPALTGAESRMRGVACQFSPDRRALCFFRLDRRRAGTQGGEPLGDRNPPLKGLHVVRLSRSRIEVLDPAALEPRCPGRT
jgi:hypothetical protein